MVIELDGSQHYTKDGLEYDLYRDLFIEYNDLRVIRFTNYEVFNNIENVVNRILIEMKE